MDQTKLYNIIALLSQLPRSEGNKLEFLQQLEKTVNETVKLLLPCEELKFKLNQVFKITPKFVLTGLYVLKLLAKFSNVDSFSNMISIQQQQKIKILLQMIFSLGVAPSLLKGVNNALINKTFQLYLLKLEELTLIESYVMMSDVVCSFAEILNASNLRSLILRHLGDLMSALIQLVHAGEFKKPMKTNKNAKNLNNSIENFIMTEEWYNRLIKERNEFKIIYEDLVKNIYKPLVIRELLILLAPSHSIEDGETVTPPIWLRKAVSFQLTCYLTSPGGVSLIMKVMCESTTDIVDWKKVESIAKLISTVHGNLSDDEFYSIIGPQIISMLSTTEPYCIPVAKKCIKNIYEYNMEICNKYIFDKLFEPFIICSKPIAENFNGTLVSEDSLYKCIDQLGQCFSSGVKEFSLPISVLIKIIKIMFDLYIKIAKSPCQLKSVIQDLLIEFLYSENDIKSLTYIYNTLIFSESHKEILKMNKDLEFQFGPSGGVQIVKQSISETSYFFGSEYELEFEIAGNHMLDLLSKHKDYSKKMLTDLFVILLSFLSDFHNSKTELPNSHLDLLSVEELIIFFIKISQKKMITIKLLADLAENIHIIGNIQENPEIVFEFIKKLLESKAKDQLHENEMNISKEELDNKSIDSKIEDTEDLFVVLSVVDLMTINLKSNSDHWNMFKSLLTSIEIIRENSQDSFIQYFSDLLFKRICTRGAVSDSKKTQTEAYNNFNSLEYKTVTNISRNKQIMRDLNNEKKKKIVGKVEKKVKDVKEIEVLLKKVCSEDIPTRGHAIIQLTNLIKEKNSEILSQKNYIFTILKYNLKHEDTYIYLAAVNALEALASVQQADKILELLCEEYIEQKKEFSELQIKIGEVLMKITRNLGEVVPKYKALLINTFLLGTKSEDELLRVSSLSNLGELLKSLGHGMANILQEVFICVERIATTDKSDEVRRAAVLVAQLLLKGVSGNTFTVLENVIRDLYRTLLKIYQTDKDEVTRLHAELALAEIDRILKSSFDKTSHLEKRIGILDFLR